MSAIAQYVFVKRPDERLDYDLDYERKGWLGAGDSIASINVTIDTTGEVAIDGTDFTGTAVKVWLTGGVAGETAHITVEIVTAQGREKEICFKVRVREC